jgi:hypothetical protein
MADERPSDDSSLPDDFRLAPGDPGSLSRIQEDDLLDREEEVSPEDEHARARTRVHLRGVLLGAVLFASLWAVLGWPLGASTIPDFLYFFRSGEAPVDLGDLRARRATGETRLAVPGNSYVRLTGQVMTYEAESETYQYFYCPLFDIITRTPRPLPAKDQYRSVEVPADLVWLVEERLAFAEDLTAGFSGEGRLLRADQAPRHHYLYDAYARTVTRPAPPDETWIFLDGDVPSDYWAYVAGYALALFLLGMSTWFFVRALRVYRRVRRSL